MRARAKARGVATRAVHSGSAPDRETGAVSPPIHQTSTFARPSPAEPPGHEYSRTSNPTRARLEECVADLEGAAHAVATASGTGAGLLVMHLLPKGSRVLCGDDLYGGTRRMFTTVFHDRHEFRFMDTTDADAVARAVRELRPRLVWLESPSNPLLKITDIEAVCGAARGAGALCLVDNTFMSPVLQNPLSLGADLVLHSMTKYLGGHSDALGGCLALDDDGLAEDLRRLQNSLGPSLSPFDAWLIHRGVRTLPLRMRAHEENAAKAARFLEGRPEVAAALWPGLPSHPGHGTARRQARGFGGMVSLRLRDGSLEAARAFLGRLSLFAPAESLGGVESLSCHPATMTHASVPREAREALGVTDGLVRLSLGVEDPDDLVADLAGALDALGSR